jgi:hypothetical protein
MYDAQLESTGQLNALTGRFAFARSPIRGAAGGDH